MKMSKYNDCFILNTVTALNEDEKNHYLALNYVLLSTDKYGVFILGTPKIKQNLMKVRIDIPKEDLTDFLGNEWFILNMEIKEGKEFYTIGYKLDK